MISKLANSELQYNKFSSIPFQFETDFTSYIITYEMFFVR